MIRMLKVVRKLEMQASCKGIHQPTLLYQLFPELAKCSGLREIVKTH